MNYFRKNLGALVMGGMLMALSGVAHAVTPTDLHKDADQALKTLIASDPLVKTLSEKAKATLIFPNIVKAGLVFGGAYGEGVLKKNGDIKGYYNSVTASWGLQIGAQSYGYIMFLMSDKAVQYLNESHGWEVGVGPTVVVMTEGMAKNISSSSMQDDAYAYIFDQQGLMAGVSIEGTKITQIKTP